MTPPNDIDALDTRDMEQLAAGQDAALNDLMDRHGKKLFHYLIRCLQNQDDAADAVQECFVRVYQNREKFDPKQKFSTWLYTIAGNLVKDRYRYRSRHPQVSLDAGPGQVEGAEKLPVPVHLLTPSERLQTEERADAVRQAVAALPEELRTPLLLAEYEELSQVEIGEILGCTAKAVETRIYRARQQLRTSLAKLLEII